MNKPQDFVELDRRFQELIGEDKPEEAALESYTRAFYGQEPTLTWDDLLRRRLVMVLGEPGSGKTWEFRQRAELLLAEGRVSFFIELEQLVTKPIDEALGPENHRRFQNWLASTVEATFFLDSVDEAKFRKATDFHTALRRFRDDLENRGLSRARILISSRISEWQPQTDKEEILRWFPDPPPRNEEKNGTVLEVPPDKNELAIVVKIEPLSRSAVERFAQARGVPVREFVEALDAHHAWEFARRPLDVVALANYWLEHGRLGSLTELIEYDIKCKLKPSGRDRNDPLSEQQARAGAEALGAATLLCRQFAFKVPDDTFMVTGVLDAPSCLPEDWRKEQWQALLTRPIFDSASYGRIRFHHRRVSEYLAAKWLEARMAEGCPKTVLDELLFDRFEGRRVLRPALAPVAAWLCGGGEPWKEDLRGWILEVAPAIHLEYGDPGQLPLEYKRKLLRALIDRYGRRKRAWIESSADALSRLADPALAEDISAIICNQSLSEDLRAEMLLLVRHGHLQACLDAALDVIASDDEPQELKTYAAEAVRDIGDQHVRRRLADIMASMPEIPNRLCAVACEALYPGAVNAGELVQLLKKTQPVPEFSLDLPYYLESHFKAAVSPETSGELLEHLIKLGQEPPHFASGTVPVSSQFSWVGKVIPTVLEKLLGKPSLTDQETGTAARALLWLGVWREIDTQHHHLDDKKLAELNQATSCHPAVRLQYLWRLVEEWRHEHASDPIHPIRLFGYYEVLRLKEEDLPWLVEDIRSQSDPQNQELTLRFAIALWESSGRHWRDRRYIRKSIPKNRNLVCIFRQLATIGPLVWLKRLWYRRVHYTLGQRWWWGQQFYWIKCRWIQFREQRTFIRYLNRLASGSQAGRLAYLCRETDEHGHSKLGISNWETMRKKRGPKIASAVKQGCKRAWRHFIPPFPHEATSNRIDNRLIVGLVGLQTSMDDGELDLATMGDEDVRLAARYAVNELNGFAPWFFDLAGNRPEPVREVLVECIRGEWRTPAEREHPYDVLHDLSWHGEGLVPLVQATILELLQEGDPPNQQILRFALTILMRQERPPAELLAAIARERVATLPSESAVSTLWLAVWLQLDAGRALDALEQMLLHISDADQIMVRLCVSLSDEPIDRGPITANPDYLRPSHLRRFIPLVYRHVRSNDDFERAGTGVYSPGDRDHAQRFRSSLLARLSKHESGEAIGVLRDLREMSDLAHLRDWIEHLIEEQIAAQADLPPWTCHDLRCFAKEYETDPKTDRDLFRITCRRLEEIKADVEKSDNSLREQIRLDADEAELRRWVAGKLMERSRNRYTVHQEEEIDQQQKPDLRIASPSIDPISIEIKWADKHWTLADLCERLENQLIGQYLRAHNRHYGVYLLGTLGRKKRWKSLDGSQDLTFEQVLDIVSARAKDLVGSRPDVEDIAVIGIDFRDPSEKEKP